jgi:hypothetical protein
MYFPNTVAALEGIRRHLKIGGHLVAAVWCTPDESPVEGLPEDIASKNAHVRLIEKGIPGPFSLTDAKTIEQKFTQAGFIEVSSEKVTVTFEFASLDDFVQYNKDAIAPLKAMVASLSPARQERIWDEIRERTAKHFGTYDGKLLMPAEVICVVGRR